jgi:hypothetical protein
LFLAQQAAMTYQPFQQADGVLLQSAGRVQDRPAGVSIYRQQDIAHSSYIPYQLARIKPMTCAA